VDVGLDYIALGQSAPTLSGGEAQRVKLAAELARPDTGKTFYLLDEPTTGLHFVDIVKLLEVMQRLVDLGNTAVVIEHNLDVVKAADHVIDLGPEAGSEGGLVVFAGTPEELVEHAAAALKQSIAPKKGQPLLLRSHTGEALVPLMKSAEYVSREQFDAAQLDQVREGDLLLEDIGRETLLPWQTDGRRWHTRDNASVAGEPIRWDRQLLVKLMEQVEAIDGFAPVNWNSPHTVEVSGPVKSRGWFLRASTHGAWLLGLKFRLPRRAFTKSQLESLVELPTLNELQDIPEYSNEPRIQAKAVGTWMELELKPYILAEIDTPAFWKWLTDAAAIFLGKTAPSSEAPAKSLDPKDQKPWKILKQRWHSLRKGFPPGRTVVWPSETLSVLIQAVHQSAGGGQMAMG
jgi:excinuclease ABC subunit A